MTLPALSKRTSFLLLRAAMGLIFITHGAARLVYGSVPDFGTFLDAQGLLFGVPLAWAITIGEIVSGSLLAIGYKVRYCVVFHAVVVAGGIVLVHIPNGWFVVGHGSGGMEYSVLILAVLALIYAYSGEGMIDGAPYEEVEKGERIEIG